MRRPEPRCDSPTATAHFAAISGIVVTDYVDEPLATSSEGSDGSGQSTDVLLRPTVTVAECAMVAEAEAKHDACFIARSVNIPVRHRPVTPAGS